MLKFSSSAFLCLVACHEFIGGAGASTALLVIDVQDCFLDANTTSGDPGSLAVGDASSIITIINDLRLKRGCLFDVVAKSQDYHPDNHISFGPTHGLDPFSHLTDKGELPLTCVNPASGAAEDASCCPTYIVDPSSIDCEAQLCPMSMDTSSKSPACTLCVDAPEECFSTTQAMWPNHCLQSGDSDFAPSLYTMESDIVVRKGSNPYVDAYSAFMDNTKKLKTPLETVLLENSVDTIYIVGLATDYCVYFSVIDALSLGFKVYVILDATRGISDDGVTAAVADMKAKGAIITDSATVLNMECPSSGAAGMLTTVVGSMGALLTAVLI